MKLDEILQAQDALTKEKIRIEKEWAAREKQLNESLSSLGLIRNPRWVREEPDAPGVYLIKRILLDNTQVFNQGALLIDNEGVRRMTSIHGNHTLGKNAFASDDSSYWVFAGPIAEPLPEDATGAELVRRKVTVKN